MRSVDNLSASMAGGGWPGDSRGNTAIRSARAAETRKPSEAETAKPSERTDLAYRYVDRGDNPTVLRRFFGGGPAGCRASSKAFPSYHDGDDGPEVSRRISSRHRRHGRSVARDPTGPSGCPQKASSARREGRLACPSGPARRPTAPPHPPSHRHRHPRGGPPR